MKHVFLILSSIALLAACTQPPARVVMKGSQDYRRPGDGYHTRGGYYDGSSSSSDDQGYAPVYTGSQRTDSTAGIGGGIQVSDLSAPQEQQQASIDNSSTNNPWTNQPRGTPTDITPSAAGYIWPIESQKVVSSYGSKGSGKVNEGINIAAEQGEPVWAAADGEVVYADSSLKGYGNMVLVKHKGGNTTTYAHLSRKVVEKYDRVKQGDIIGYVGATGNVSSPQLYFAVREGAEAVDPKKYIGQ